jgi:hypothetical protein
MRFNQNPVASQPGVRKMRLAHHKIEPLGEGEPGA